MNERLRLLVLDRSYPDGVHQYGDVFVHIRAKEYAKWAEVVVASVPNERAGWNHEGIPVETFPTVAGAAEFMARFRPHAVLGHFVERPLIRDLLLGSPAPFIVWVHGYEGLGWYRRLFDVEGPVALLQYAQNNMRQLLALRRLIRWANRSGRGAFVFPSRWMRRVTQIDTAQRIRRALVIPNPIDGEMFRYTLRAPAMRRRVLLIRSFELKKYATDMAVSAIQQLARRGSLPMFQFDLYGEGRFFDAAARDLAPFRNVHMHNHFVPHRDVPELHRENGVLLCPTRQDAQGVTMCEGMSSGLVPVTSRNTAIPEFVADGVSGFLTSSADEIAARLEELATTPQLFARMSENAAREIREKCELAAVIERELQLIKEVSGEKETVASQKGR